MRAEVTDIRKPKPWAGLTAIFPAIRPKTKSDIQPLRKLWHMGMMLTVALLYMYVATSKEAALFWIVVIGGPEVILDLLRLRWKKLNRFVIFIFGPLMRKRELASLSSMAYFLIALFLITAIFPKPVVILAILCLAFGDPVANIVGIRFGKDMITKGKSLQGTLACFGVCSILTFLVLALFGIPSDYLFLISLAGGFSAAAGEVLASKIFDDNFLVPIMTASVIYPLLLLLADF